MHGVDNNQDPVLGFSVLDNKGGVLNIFIGLPWNDGSQDEMDVALSRVLRART